MCHLSYLLLTFFHYEVLVTTDLINAPLFVFCCEQPDPHESTNQAPVVSIIPMKHKSSKSANVFISQSAIRYPSISSELASELVSELVNSMRLATFYRHDILP